MASFKSYTQWLTRFTSKLQNEVEVAERASLAQAETIAHGLSQGNLSLAWLAAAGHPYAKRFVGPPPQDPAIVHRQGGAFDAGWATNPVTYDPVAGAVVAELINHDPVAAFLDQGTVWMIARPFRDRIIDEVTPVRVKNLGDAVNRAVQ